MNSVSNNTLLSAVSAGDYDEVARLSKSPSKGTILQAFQIACDKKQYDIVEFFIQEMDVRISQKVYTDACMKGDLKLVDMFFGGSEDLSDRTVIDEYSPFDYACQSGNLELMDFLLRHGQDWGYNSFYKGCFGGMKVIDFLVNLGAENNMDEKKKEEIKNSDIVEQDVKNFVLQPRMLLFKLSTTVIIK